MSASMTSLDDDLERLQNFSKDQILHYVDSKLSTLIESLENSSIEPVDAVKSTCILMEHCLPCYDNLEQAEKHILASTLPYMERLFIEMYNIIVQQVREGHRIEIIEGLLQVVTTLVCCIKSCVHFYAKLESVIASDMEQFCKGIFPAVLKTLQHCSDSATLYGPHAETLTDELRCFIGEVSDLMVQLVNLFRDVVQFNVDEREYEVIVLTSVSEFFGHSCVLTQVLGVRVMTECWKFYTSIAVKYAQHLAPVISIDELASHLSNEVKRLTTSCIEQADASTSERTLKIANFMLRILIGLLEKGYATSVDQSIAEIIDLLIFLQSNSELLLQLTEQKTSPCVQMIDRQLVVGTGSIISSLADKPEFSKSILSILESNKDNSSDKEPIDKVLLNTAILQELKNLDPGSRRHWVADQNNIFTTLINLLDQSPFALNQVGSGSKTGVYETCLASSLGLAMTLSASEFLVLEKTLFNSMCSSPATPWPWIFSSDLWVCVVKSAGPQLCNEHITFLQSSVETLAIEPQRAVILALVERLAQILPQHQFDPTQFEIDKLNTAVQIFQERPSNKAYKQTLDALDAIYNKKPNLKVLNTILELMPFLQEGELGEQLGTRILSLLVQHTDIMENHHLVSALSHFSLLSSVALRIKTVEFLSGLAKKTLPTDSDQKSVIQLIAETFNDVLQHFNPVVQQEALAVFAEFASVSPHEKIVSLTVRNSQDLQNQVALYIQKTPHQVNASSLTELRRLSKIKRCTTKEIKVESAQLLIADFSNLDDDDFFDMDDEVSDANGTPFGSQAPCSPRLDAKETAPRVLSESDCSQGAKFSPVSQASQQLLDENQDLSEPLVQELASLVDSLVKSNKKSGLGMADKKKIKGSITKLQNLIDDNF